MDKPSSADGSKDKHFFKGLREKMPQRKKPATDSQTQYLTLGSLPATTGTSLSLSQNTPDLGDRPATELALVPGSSATSRNDNDDQENPSESSASDEDMTDFLDLLYEPKEGDAPIDIVAVHGMNLWDAKNHARGTWTAKNKQLWLEDFLPLHAKNARVLLFGYNSNVAINTTSAGVVDQATQLLMTLKDKRKKTSKERPILFICHSLGGLVVEQALIKARLAEDYLPIARSTCGIVFFATPHKGGHGADIGSTAAWWARKFSRNVENDVTQSLKNDDASANMLRENYKEQLGDYPIVSFYEDIPMTIGVGKMIIVDKDSATFGLSSRDEKVICMTGTNHSTVCKFSSRTSQGYRKVEPRIDDLIEEALEKVKIRDEKIAAGDEQVKKQLLCTIQINEELEAIHEDIKILQTQGREKARDDFLEWLSDIDPSHNYRAAIETRKKVSPNKTGNWLLKDTLFKRWQKDPNSLLWLNGKVGSGKSVLCAIAVKYLREVYDLHPERYPKSDPKIALAHFYFDFNNIKKQNADALLWSITKQLCSSMSSLPGSMDSLLQYKKQGQRPDVSGLERALLATIHEFTDVYVVIDAIDECPLNTGERSEVLASLLRLRGQSPSSLHILITSRREFDIEEAVLMQPRITDQSPILDINLSNLQGAVDLDIGLFIDQTFKEQPFCDSRLWTKEIQEETKSALIEKADGMFQYVSSQFFALQFHKSAGRIRKALQKLPEGKKRLDETYQRMLKAINPEYRKQVASTLKWLTYCLRPLYLEELAEIFILDPQNDTPFVEDDRLRPIEAVLGYLSGFVTKIASHNPSYQYGHPRKEAMEIRFAHFSIQEYISSENLLEEHADFSTRDETSSHLHIGESCLAYNLQLSSKLLATQVIQREQYCLWHYVANQGLMHLEKVSNTQWNSSTFDKLKITFAAQSQAQLNLERQAPPDTFSYWGHHGIYKDNFEKKVDDVSTPLCYAVRCGLYQLSKYLLNQVVDIHEISANKGNETALEIAVSTPRKRTDLLELLLDHGADANKILMGDRERSDYPLALAASGSNTKMVDLLLAHRADVNAMGNWHGSALQAAACSKQFDQVQLLLNHGARVNIQGGWYGNALQAAVFGGDVKVVQLLLDHGANVNLEGGEYGTALQAAAKNGRPEIFHLLLDRNADVNIPGGLYGSVLQAAICCHIPDFVDILLEPERKTDVNIRGGKYGNALQAAIGRNGDAKLAELLLKRGAQAIPPGEEWDAFLASPRPPWPSFVEGTLSEFHKDPRGYVSKMRKEQEERLEDERRLRKQIEERLRRRLQKQQTRRLGDISCDDCGAMNLQIYYNGFSDCGSFDLCQSCRKAIAIEYDRYQMFRFVIESGKVSSIPLEHYGNTLQAALADKTTKSLEITELLLSHGAKIDVAQEVELKSSRFKDKCNRASGLLLSASRHSDESVFDLLLSRLIEGDDECEEDDEREEKKGRRRRRGFPWVIHCDRCDALDLGAHHHCMICNRGNFDICQNCVDNGALCLESNHHLSRRLCENGKLIHSFKYNALSTHVWAKTQVDTGSSPSIVPRSVVRLMEKMAKKDEGQVNDEDEIEEQDWETADDSEEDDVEE